MSLLADAHMIRGRTFGSKVRQVKTFRQSSARFMSDGTILSIFMCSVNLPLDLRLKYLSVVTAGSFAKVAFRKPVAYWNLINNFAIIVDTLNLKISLQNLTNRMELIVFECIITKLWPWRWHLAPGGSRNFSRVHAFFAWWRPPDPGYMQCWFYKQLSGWFLQPLYRSHHI